MAAATLQNESLVYEVELCCARARTPRILSMREFAEKKFIIPEGRYKNLKFRIHRQPYAGLLFDAIDSGNWTRFAILCPVQSGKTTHGFVIPTLYHLFEHSETIVCFVPQMDLAHDKWRDEIRPAIMATRKFRQYMPTKGPGSRGGTGNLGSIQFGHGPVLKFMSGHGGDEARSSFTTRVVVTTEVDKSDTARVSSRETDPISQTEARMLAQDDDQTRFYMECTVSIVAGRIWVEYTLGTASRIACSCPHCDEYVTPEREHLFGWQDAENKIDARDMAWFACPTCGEQITESERIQMNQVEPERARDGRVAKLVHRGQTIDKSGMIHGDPPKTDTLGFRASAFNNMFWRPGRIGAREWVAAHAIDEENAEKELRQFWWAMPWEPEDLEITPLNAEKLRKRTGRLGRGVVPSDVEHAALGVDLGKWMGHYVLLTSRTNTQTHIADYGIFDINSDDFGVEKATIIALREFREQVLAGWSKESGGIVIPEQEWIDSAYYESQHVVYGFCRESPDERFRPTKGYGATQQSGKVYNTPEKKSAQVRFIGHQYHISRLQAKRIKLVHVNVDYWKTWVRERLASPINADGAMTLFAAPPREHIKFSKHLTAEQPILKDGVVVWETISHTNHWGDALTLAAAALHFCGARLVRTGDAPTQLQSLAGWFAKQRKAR